MAVKRIVRRGTTYSVLYQHQHDGVNHTLVGATLYLTVKTVESDDSADDATAVIQKTVTSHTNAAAGQSTIELTPTDTYIDPADYKYDIRVKEAGGRVYVVDEGIMTIDGSPTNRASV